MTCRWPTAKLGELCEIQRGGSPRPIDDYITDSPEGINWIKIGDVGEGEKYILSTKQKIRPEGGQRSRFVESGDFLLTNSMSFGRPYILRTSGCIHDGWLVLRYDRERLSEDYLYHVLSSDNVYAQFVKMASGAVVKNLNSEVVKAVEIPLPPLPEQIRIAAILDKADALRIKRREASAQLDRLAQSIFVEMFSVRTELFIKQLGAVAQLKRGPFGGALKKEIFTSEGAMVYEQRNAIQDDCLTGRYFISQEKYVEMEDFAVLPGDLIVSCSGTLGRVAIVPEHAPQGIINQALLRVRANRTVVTSTYLKYALESRDVQSRLTGLSHGTGLQNFPPMSEIRGVEIPMPPMEMQFEFERRLGAVKKQEYIAKEAVTRLDELFASLQRGVFQGDL